jgi:hypothetical protein
MNSSLRSWKWNSHYSAAQKYGESKHSYFKRWARTLLTFALYLPTSAAEFPASVPKMAWEASLPDEEALGETQED